MIPHVTEVPGHPDPVFEIPYFLTPFPLIGFLFHYLAIINFALRDHSSEKDFQACF